MTTLTIVFVSVVPSVLFQKVAEARAEFEGLDQHKSAGSTQRRVEIEALAQEISKLEQEKEDLEDV